MIIVQTEPIIIQKDSNINGTGDACDSAAIIDCIIDPIASNNLNQWIGSIIVNWYDDPCY